MVRWELASTQSLPRSQSLVRFWCMALKTSKEGRNPEFTKGLTIGFFDLPRRIGWSFGHGIVSLGSCRSLRRYPRRIYCFLPLAVGWRGTLKESNAMSFTCNTARSTCLSSGLLIPGLRLFCTSTPNGFLKAIYLSSSAAFAHWTCCSQKRLRDTQDAAPDSRD